MSTCTCERQDNRGNCCQLRKLQIAFKALKHEKRDVLAELVIDDHQEWEKLKLSLELAVINLQKISAPLVLPPPRISNDKIDREKLYEKRHKLDSELASSTLDQIEAIRSKTMELRTPERKA